MASFTDLFNDVVSITNRPDLVDQTKLAIRSATLKAHHSDFYPKDLFETGIEWSNPALLQSLEYKTVVPLWRSFKYLKKYENGVPGKFFQMITPEESLDSYSVNRENVCYLAGSFIEIRSNTQDKYMLLGCYVHPTVTELNYTSWIAEDHPFAIVYEAAANVFKQTGYDEQFAVFRDLKNQEYEILKQEIIGEGY